MADDAEQRRRLWLARRAQRGPDAEAAQLEMARETLARPLEEKVADVLFATVLDAEQHLDKFRELLAKYPDAAFIESGADAFFAAAQLQLARQCLAMLREGKDPGYVAAALDEALGPYVQNGDPIRDYAERCGSQAALELRGRINVIVRGHAAAVSLLYARLDPP